MVSAASRIDFSFSSLTLGLAVLSAPSVRVAYPQVSAPEASPEHRSVLVVEEAHGGGRGWGSIEPTRVVALPSARNEAPTQGERGCNGLLPFGHHSPKALCAMVVQASSTCIPMCRPTPSLPSPQDVSSQPTAVLCLGLLSRPHIPAPSPCLQQWTPSQAGWAELGSAPCVEASLCPVPTCWLLCSLPTENEAPLLSQLSSHQPQ